MIIKDRAFLLLFFYFVPSYALNVKLVLIESIYTPNSILEHKELYEPLFIANRPRYATCTAAAWFHKNYLAVLNFLGQNITTYIFYPETHEVRFVQKIDNTQGARLNEPEHLIVSPDGTMLVVCNTRRCNTVYAVDPITRHIDPKPIFTFPIRDISHNARFTSDGKYLAYTTFHRPEAICIYKVERDNQKVSFKHVFKLNNSLKLSKVRAINFTQDSRFAIIAMGNSIWDSNTLGSRGELLVYAFDHEQGILKEVVSQVAGNFSFEDIALLDHDHVIVLSDQAHDQIIFYPFDPQTGQITDGCQIINSPEVRLSFPHGISISEDSNFLAVANYGDDK